MITNIFVQYDRNCFFADYNQPVDWDGGLFNPVTPPSVVLRTSLRLVADFWVRHDLVRLGLQLSLLRAFLPALQAQLLLLLVPLQGLLPLLICRHQLWKRDIVSCQNTEATSHAHAT